MPNDIDSKVAAAKSALSDANTKFPSPKTAAPAMKTAAPAAPAPKAPSVGDELNVKAKNIDQYDKAVPKMHKGGKVDEKVLGDKKEGPVVLEKGETVRTEEQEKKMQDKVKEPKKAAELMGGAKPKADKPEEKSEKKDGKGGKKKHKHTHIEHHDDGTHTVRHTPAGGGDEVSYAKPDLAGVHEGLDANLGGGEAPEEAAEAAPAAGAAPAAPAAAAMPVKV